MTIRNSDLSEIEQNRLRGLAAFMCLGLVVLPLEQCQPYFYSGWFEISRREYEDGLVACELIRLPTDEQWREFWDDYNAKTRTAQRRAAKRLFADEELTVKLAELTASK